MRTIKIYSATVLMLISTMCVAQDSRFSLGLSVYPNASLARITNDGTVSKDLEKEIRLQEKAKISGSIAFLVQYKLNDKFDIQSGIGFQNNGYLIDNLLFEGDSLPLGQFNTAQAIRNYNRIEIPLILRYRINPIIHVSAGLSPVYTFSNCTKVQFEDESENTKSCAKGLNTNDYNIFFNVGTGITLTETEKMSVTTEIYAQYGALGLLKDSSLKRNILTTGLRVNWLFQL